MVTLNSTGLEGSKRKLVEVYGDDGVPRKNAWIDAQLAASGVAAAAELAQEARSALDIRCKQFLVVLTSNAVTSRRLRRLEQRTEELRRECDALQNGPHGRTDLETQTAEGELPSDNIDELRGQCYDLEVRMESARKGFAHTELVDMRTSQMQRNNRMYDFGDLRPEAPGLVNSPRRFWDLLNCCQGINKALQTLEERLHAVEQRQANHYQYVDGYAERIVGRGGKTWILIASEDYAEDNAEAYSEILAVRMAELDGLSKRKYELMESVEDVRLQRLEAGIELNDFVYETLEEWELLASQPENGVEEAPSQHPRPSRRYHDDENRHYEDSQDGEDFAPECRYGHSSDLRQGSGHLRDDAQDSASPGIAQESHTVIQIQEMHGDIYTALPSVDQQSKGRNQYDGRRASPSESVGQAQTIIHIHQMKGNIHGISPSGNINIDQSDVNTNASFA